MNEHLFKTIDEQIEHLKDYHKLNIPNEDYAKNALKEYGYYEIVNGYKEPFLKDSNKEQFKESVKFEDLVELFNFDQNLRAQMTQPILMFELMLRQSAVRAFGKIYGSTQNDYLNLDNYRTQDKKLYKFISKLLTNGLSKREEYVKHFKGDVPLWIMVKTFDFGDLSTFVSLMKNEAKREIISEFYGEEQINTTSGDEIYQLFGNTVDLLRQFRNQAAHGGRFYSFRSTQSLPYVESIFSLFKINKEDYNNSIGKNGLGALLLALYSLQLNLRPANYGLGSVMSTVTNFYSQNFELRQYLYEKMLIPEVMIDFIKNELK